jgi:hypothetical protein
VIANPTAAYQHTTTEELLEAVFSVIRAAAIASQRRGKRIFAATVELNNRRAVFSTWSMPRGYKRDERGALFQDRLAD